MRIYSNSSFFGFTKIKAVIFLLVGIILTVVGIASMFSKYRKTQTYEITSGKIVDAVVNAHEDSLASYAPVYQFTVDEQTYQFNSHVSTQIYPDIGASVSIYYNPENPEDAFTKGPMVLEIIETVFGIFFIICAISMKKEDMQQI